MRSLFRFYESVDWPSVRNKKLVPPIVPCLVGENDTRNYFLYNGNTQMDNGVATEENREIFGDF